MDPSVLQTGPAKVAPIGAAPVGVSQALDPFEAQRREAMAKAEAAKRAYATEQMLVKTATDRFRNATSADRENRENSLEDAKFLVGEQWSALDLMVRRYMRRPALTVNRLPQFVKQITGELRRNRPAIRCMAADGAASPAIAQAYEGIIRGIERASDSESVYAIAANSQAAAGIGHMRVTIEHEDDESFDDELVLRIRPIRNFLSVVWDPDALQQDYSDAKFCFVFEEISREEFKAQFPDEATSSGFAVPLPWSDQRQYEKRNDTVTRMEYWCVETVDVLRVRIQHPQFGQVVLEDPEEQFLAETLGPFDPITGDGGWTETARRLVKRRKICQYYLADNRVIAGPYEYPGSRIPIFSAIGEEWDVGGTRVRHGLIRNAKDSQRKYNVAATAQVEQAMMAPKAPWIGTEAQFKGREEQWARAHESPHNALAYNYDPHAPGPPKRTDPIPTNPGLSELIGNSTEELQATTGVYNAAIGARSQEASGVAIDAREAQVDTGLYVYIDNFSRCLAAVGRELVALIPKVYSAKRWIRIVGDDDAATVMDLERLQAEEGPLDAGRYDVIVRTGPSFLSRRQQSTDGMLKLAQIAAGVGPQFLAPLLPRIAKNSDWPDAEAIGAEYEQLVRAMVGAAAPGMPPGMPPATAQGGAGDPMAAAPMSGASDPAAMLAQLPPDVERLLASMPAPRPGEPIPPQVAAALDRAGVDPRALEDLLSTVGAPAASGNVGPRRSGAGAAGMMGDQQ